MHTGQQPAAQAATGDNPANIATVAVVARCSLRRSSARTLRPLPRRPHRSKPTATHTVTFDKYSLMIDGQRTFVWSGEFHPFRLPSPGLWRDVLQKMKAEGYTAVSIYFDWGYHSPSPGVYDFTGVRDMDRLLDHRRRGRAVRDRPAGSLHQRRGHGGGFPGLAHHAGRPGALRRARLPRRHRRVAARDRRDHRPAPAHERHRLGDPVPDRERAGLDRHLAAQLPAAPVRQGPRRRHHASRSSTTTRAATASGCRASSTVPGTVPGPVDLYAFDGYPGGTCHTDGSRGAPSNAAPDWGIQGAGGAKGGATASPETPGFAAEFGGGWFDYWGSVGTYPCTACARAPATKGSSTAPTWPTG